MTVVESSSEGSSGSAKQGVKASSWLTPEEYKKLDSFRGDISMSLMIKRAIRTYIKLLEEKESKEEEKNELRIRKNALPQNSSSLVGHPEESSADHVGVVFCSSSLSSSSSPSVYQSSTRQEELVTNTAAVAAGGSNPVG